MWNPFVTKILKRVAPQIGAKLFIEPEYQSVGQIEFKDGRKQFFKGRSLNINSISAVEVVKDKAYTKFFLQHFGYKTPLWQTFFHEKINKNVLIKRGVDDGYIFAKKIGFPVILKPNNGSQGILVTKVRNKKEYYSAAKKIMKDSSVMLVEEFCSNYKDYRIVVLDREVISAYERIPLSLIGDGKSSLNSLLDKKQKLFRQQGRPEVIDTKDFRIKATLKSQYINFEDILKNGEELRLLDNANLSTGGTAVDYTESIHNKYKNLAVKVTKDMGLRFCGVDILTKDIETRSDDYSILELNGAPGLDNYATVGKAQEKKVDDLYLKILMLLDKEK